MDILHFCPSRSFSGLEQYALQLAVDQAHKGKQVGFVVFPGSEMEKRCRAEGVEPVPFDPYKLAGTVRFWPTLARVLSSPTLKVVHLHSTQELFHLSGGMLFNKL